MKNDYKRIKEEVKKRGITRLCHITQSRKLPHILSEAKGIVCLDDLRNKYSDLLDPTDKQRLDRHTDYISCSIEYPNIWYFNKIKNKDPLFKDWVILFLTPSLLWNLETKFCPGNAAAMQGRLCKHGFPAFQKLFDQKLTDPEGRTFSRTSEMLGCCPTNGQAEVLVHKFIPISNIIGIAVHDKEQAREEIDRLEMCGINMDINCYIAPELFTQKWRVYVRSGRSPPEELY